MNCELTADIPVERFAVLAELACMESRPELGLLCRAALAAGHRISAEAVEKALPGVRGPGAANIVSWCRLLGLCDEQGSLTKLGVDVAASDEAPVPEQGLYELWAVDHPLLGRRILHFERLNASRDVKLGDVTPLPLALELNRTFESVVEPGTHFVLRGLPAGRGVPSCVRRPGLKCRLRWRLDFDAGVDRWQLEGELATENRRLPFKHTAETERLDLWALFTQWAQAHLTQTGRWDATARRLSIPFARVQGLESSQEDFTLSHELPVVSVPGKGEYTRVKVQGIPVAPATSDDASQWARARLERKLSAQRAYLTRGGLRRLFLSVVEDTPLAPLQPTLASHDVLARETRGRPEVFWGLVAPVDLAPFPVTEERAAFTAGAPMPAPVAASGARVVNVPHRGTWSMQQLVTALLEGARPRRVLLCDGHVRGDHNLKTLELMVQTLREFQPAVHVEVVTIQDSKDAQSFERIRKLVGRQPRPFPEFFGTRRGEHPHDRYLLVETDSGEHFGWQMSNSPLDARAGSNGAPTPKSPLLWHDFSAHRLERHTLPVRLGQWFEEGAR